MIVTILGLIIFAAILVHSVIIASQGVGGLAIAELCVAIMIFGMTVGRYLPF